MSESNQTQMQSEQQYEQYQQQQIVSMFQWPIGPDGQQYPLMIPYFIQFFQGFMYNLERLDQTRNNKWTNEQDQAYTRFLNDVKSYVVTYIYTGQVWDFNAFMKTMNDYGEYQNPVGMELYQNQLQYITKKDQGFDFKLDKKKKKKQKMKELGIEDRPKIRERDQKPKEQIVIRKDDPTITAAELITKQFPQDRYTDLNSFKKQNANLIFIGHVDSGKSTLTGNIMKELKEVDEQQLTRNKQQAKENNMQAWQLAFIADVDPNQRKRGKTVQCSKMMFNLPNRRFTLFDAPGHKGYVPNMMMGACQADIAVLIISAKQGQFQSGFEKEGQTKQHSMLATALGVQGMIAVVTKMSTVQWSQERFNHIREQVSPFLSNSCGFKNVPFIPIDSINNINVHKESAQGWYKGPCLVTLLNSIKIPERNPDGPLRIPVVDKFKDVGQFFLYGKVQSGKIAYENQTVSLLPNREYLTIKEIYNAKDQRLPYALAGQNVKLRVKGIQEDQVHRGDIICSNLNYCQQSQQFRANLTVLELPEHKKLISSGYQCIIHMHAISQGAEISLVDGKIDPTTKKTHKATFLRTGQTGKVVIKLKNSICLEKFDFMEHLGRFTLRDQGKTIGFGEVTKIKPAKNLTKEQKDQLTSKNQEQALANDLEKKAQIKE